MRWLIGSGLRFGRIVIALAIGLLFVAITQLPSAAVDVYPQFGPESVEIQAEAPGLSAAEVEQLITVPIEQDLLNGVPWLDGIHSLSMPGLSVIDMTFQLGTNLYSARQMVEERMTQAHALPNVGSPPIMIQPLSSLGRVEIVRLSSARLSLIDLSVLVRWKIRPRLMGVPGVASVAVYGQRDRQLQVLVNPRLLGARRVSLTQVIETVGNALWVSPLTFVEASTPGTGGFVESPSQRLNVQHIFPISQPWQLAEVPVQDTGRPAGLRLGQVAKVVIDHQPLIGDSVSGGAPGLYLVIEKSPGASTLAVTRAVDQALAAMAPGLPGVSIDTHVFRPVTYIETALANACLAGLIGLGLLVVFLVLFLASWRAALIAVAAVAVSLAAAAFVLYLRGTTFTTMTLLGLAAALGVVIDEVINDIDAARRRLAADTDAARGRARTVTLTEAFASVRGPLTIATLAILTATLPLVALGPLAAAFTRPLVLTFALAVLAAMLVAFMLTPALAALLLRGGAIRPGWFAGLVRRGTGRMLSGSLARPGRAWPVAAGLAAVGLGVTLGLMVPQAAGRSVLPPLQDRNLLLRLETVPGTSLAEMDRVTAAVASGLRALPGVTEVGAHVGRAVGSDQLVGVNSAEVWITLSPGADYGRSLAAIERFSRGFAGVSATLLTYPAAQIAQARSGQSAGLVVRVYGADLATLQAKAEQVRAVIARVPGIADPVARRIPLQPTVDVEVSLGAAQKYGLRPGDVRRAMTTLTSGLVVGSLYEESKIFDVVVWGAPQTRANLTDLRNLLIDTPSGRQVPLKAVATVTIRPEPAAIPHDDVMRDVEVTAAVTGDPGEVTAAVRAVVARVPMPYEYHAEVSGNAVARQGVLIRVSVCAAAALAIIFLLFQAAAGSWRRAGLMLLSLPLSLVGGLLTAQLAGGAWSAGALAGLFAVLALAIRASVLLGRATRREPLAGAEAEVGGRRAVTDAAAERAVPLLLSALALVVVLLPAAIIGSTVGLEMLHPLAVTVLGGLASLAVVQVLVLPALLAAGRRQP